MGEPVTLVLGLGREVGNAVARTFQDEGHRILVADPLEERLESARDALEDGAATYHGELHSRLGLRNAITAALEAFGRIDNAVIIPEIEDGDQLLDFAQEKFEKALARSARGAALALRVIAERLLEQEDLPQAGVQRIPQKGTITFVLGYAAIASMPGRFTESVGQHAILGVMKAGALELAEHAIRVNAVIAIRPREERSESWTARRVPLGRAAKSDEIAEAVRYIASPQAAYLTGQSLVLDGGRSTLSGMLD
ncbi:MAG: SDR family oxidoreductase [Hyphomonas sp.]|jgi:3-oxoacyl-[acyl-carrier protein] reductase|nr:SDR family oxidoreductase [Hyphomonas sp.]MDP3459625.1 SDR family oxidoreductase [Hyphomonas sp.]